MRLLGKYALLVLTTLVLVPVFTIGGAVVGFVMGAFTGCSDVWHEIATDWKAIRERRL